MTTTDEITFPGPDEIEGFWNLDKMHAPRPVTPLSFDLVVRTLAEGFTKAQAEYDCPIMVSTKEVNHYFYVAFHPIPDEAEIADRMTRYHGKLAEKVPGVGKTWDEVWKPEVIASNVALKTADYSALSDGELVTKLDELTDEMRHQWWIHGHINFVLLSSSAFCDLYDAIMRPDDPTESYQTLHGFPTTSVDASRGLWALSRTVLASPALTELFQSHRARGPARGARRQRGGSGVPAAARRLPVRVRLAPRRRLRPRRRALAGEPGDPAGQHRQDDGARRERRPRGRLPAEGRPARGAARRGPRPAGRRARDARQLRRALRAGALQLPAHRGPRLLHRSALHQRAPQVLPRRRRAARGQGRRRRARRRLLPLP